MESWIRLTPTHHFEGKRRGASQTSFFRYSVLKFPGPFEGTINLLESRLLQPPRVFFSLTLRLGTVIQHSADIPLSQLLHLGGTLPYILSRNELGKERPADNSLGKALEAGDGGVCEEVQETRSVVDEWWD